MTEIAVQRADGTVDIYRRDIFSRRFTCVNTATFSASAMTTDTVTWDGTDSSAGSWEPAGSYIGTKMPKEVFWPELPNVKIKFTNPEVDEYFDGDDDMKKTMAWYRLYGINRRNPDLKIVRDIVGPANDPDKALELALLEHGDEIKLMLGVTKEQLEKSGGDFNDLEFEIGAILSYEPIDGTA